MGRRRFGIGATLVVLILAVTASSPFIRWSRADRTIPYGDARLNLWILSWNQHILPTDPGRYFDANIFFPHGNALAASEHLLLPSLLAWPFAAATGNPLIGFYALILLSFLATFWGVYHLSREWGLPPPAALAAGSGFTFSTGFVAQAFGHVQTMQPFWMLGALVFLRRWLREGRRWDLALLTVCAAGQVLSSWYLSVYLVLLGGLALIFPAGRGQARLTLRKLLGLGASGAIVTGLSAPLLLPYLGNAFGAGAPADLLSGVGLLDYVKPVPWTLWWRALSLEAPSPPPFLFFLGYLVLIPALLVPILRRRRAAGESPGLAPFLLAILVLGVVLSLGPAWMGPDGQIRLRLPLHYLARVLPILRPLRDASRIALVAQLAAAVLAGLGLSRLTAGWKPRGRWIAGCALALLIPLESHFFMRLEPPSLEPTELDRWLAVEAEGCSLAMIPDLSFVGPVGMVVDYQARSIYHWRPLVNGDSRFLPPGYRRLSGLLNGFPSPECIRVLREMGVDLAVVHPHRFVLEEMRSAVAEMERRPLSGDVEVLNRFVREVMNDPHHTTPEWERVRQRLESQTELPCLARFPDGWIYDLRQGD